jgi:hypothetical protein
MRLAACIGLLLTTTACTGRSDLNYRNCLRLRVGMTRGEVFATMGPPDETMSFVEGKSPEHLRGRTAYEWGNPASMAAPNHVSVIDATEKTASIRCANVELSAETESPVARPAGTSSSKR